MPSQSVCSNDYPFVTTFPASQPWDAADPLPVMRREMKLLLIEIGQLRTEVEQLRAKEEEVQNVKEFLYRVIESRDQWQREAQRLRALMAKMPRWLLFCGRCLMRTPMRRTRSVVGCARAIANQLNRWRTLVGVATSSSSFVAIRYGSELLNRTSTQVGVSLDMATTAPSSWVTAWRTLSPILMLMPLSFSPSRCA